MSLPLDLIVLLAAGLVAWLIFTWSLQVLKTSISTALTIAVLAIILQIFLGISFEQVWQELVKYARIVWEFLAPYLSFLISRG